jgi:predicted nucleotidyltransferase
LLQNVVIASGVLEVFKVGFGIVEGHYFMLKDGTIFYVKGVSHPPSAVIAFPKYVPSEFGERLHPHGIRYAKIVGVDQQFQHILSVYPSFVTRDAYFCYRPTPVVKLEYIKHLYNPIEKAANILDMSKCSSPALCDTKEFLKLIADVGGVREVGVSGSILVDLHTPGSDIDIVVYGEGNALKMYKFLVEAIDEGVLGLRRYDENALEKLYRERSLETPLPFKAFVELERRRVLEGMFKSREYFIRLIKEPKGDDLYGAYTCTKVGAVEVKLRIDDDSESIYTPCRYKVSIEEVIRGPKAEIEEIYTLRGRFNEIAKKGEVVIARGSLERIEYRSGKTKYRLYLGDLGDYMMPLT